MTSASIGLQADRPANLDLVRRLKDPALLLLPALAFLAFIYLLPLIDLIRISVSGPSWTSYFERVFAIPLYWDSLVRTMQISVTVACLCLLFGYPTALLIHRSRGITQALIATAIVLPYFIAILIRTYAWMVLLGRNGPVNKMLVSIGILSEPVQLLFNRGTVLLGMTAVLLPLMVLTIYSSVARLDQSLTRAALASGAGPIAAFWRVMLPLTLPGMGAGFLLVFVAAIGFFITPTLLGGPGDQMFAMHITQQADSVTSEGFLQALGVVLLTITLAVVAVAGRFLGFEFIWGGRKLTEATPTTTNRRAAGVSRRSLGASAADAIGWPLLRLFGRLPASFGTWTVRLMGGLVIAILILPIIVVMIISFSSASYLTFPPPGFSFRWYEQFFSDSNWMRAFWTSLVVATMSAGIAIVLGASAALGIVRSSIRGKSTIMLLLVSPIIVPPVVLGLSLYSLFLRFDLVGSVFGLAAAHAIGGLPLVVVILSASLQGVDTRLEQAAAVHGASSLTVFRLVTLPAIMPGLAAATFFAFLHSFDELVLTLFLSSAELKTLPLMLWGDVNYRLNPVLAVVSTLEVLLVIAGLALARPVLATSRKAT
ncbi:ABC transporter permease [Bradyrhizobium sp. WBOS7]|uniref:ABC transporter permease n=1 Tax=Bradyrhizobium betae TaxID=244734 RepID=A0AAE9NFU3_9BRAD|nr:MULTISPECIES: ABC transporter permease subunit [Bradyrhizobium]MDD1573403.1 ABC transporter permease [Bradyrhizobium sp. WBOS1]UUO38393.1 ABC transporter permease [Bradyrhizobium sp. WBOS01]MDD1530378.1 ABC transporter permease [Bradyrhizobium sp. WBOS2]MDD1579538.1 ABC transporter permease [Bradyrhizobium sp. WBOS7]MDD1603061.1 ABC transporter permease [Bradyrhizobium sp. WBOS16]